MWQKCPICKGTGKTKNTVSSSGFDICLTCNGKKIISQLNVLPPNYEQNKIERQKANIPNQINEILKQYPSTDFRDGNFETQQEYFGK
jgi:DnaJ-class molecular chaperone